MKALTSAMLSRLRWWVVVITAVLIVGATVAILGTALLGWTFGMGNVDVPTRINTVVATCAFILVAATLFVALVAYLAATGKPNLSVRLTCPYAPWGQQILVTPSQGVSVDDWKDATVRVTVWNYSAYSARNPSVRVLLITPAGVEIKGLTGHSQQGWSVVEGMGSNEQVQWDGGADYMIHPNWSRVLPDLNFGEVTRPPGDGGLTDLELMVTVVADGMTPQFSHWPVQIGNSDEYRAALGKEVESLRQTRAAQLDEVDPPV